MDKDDSFIFIERLVITSLMNSSKKEEAIASDTGLEVPLVKEILFNLINDGAVERCALGYRLKMDFKSSYDQDLIEDVEDAALVMLCEKKHLIDNFLFRKVWMSESEKMIFESICAEMRKFINRLQGNSKGPTREQVTVLCGAGDNTSMLEGFWGHSN